MATVRIPTAMRTLTGGKAEVPAAGATVGQVLEALDQAHPGIRARLFDERGLPRRYVNVFHNEEDIRFLQGLETPVGPQDRVTIVPAMAGG